MYWVRLTEPEGGNIYVNLYRFDMIARTNDDKLTIIKSTLSQTEEDFVFIEVIERPEDFIPLMES